MYSRDRSSLLATGHASGLPCSLVGSLSAPVCVLTRLLEPSRLGQPDTPPVQQKSASFFLASPNTEPPVTSGRHAPAVREAMDFDRHDFLTKLGFAALTFNSGLAVYRSRGDPGTVAFVAGAYAAIALLFHLLRSFERAGPGAAGRGRTKAAVWVLTTLLTAMFAARVAPLMPAAVGFLVWLMAAATAAGGFWALLLNP